MKLGKIIVLAESIVSKLRRSELPTSFVIYGADLEKWLKHSVAHTYADDMKSGATGKTVEEVKEKLEEDASNVLKFLLTYLLTHSLTHSLTHPLTHSLTYLPLIQITKSFKLCNSTVNLLVSTK